MDRITRRQFMERALILGVGTSLVGGFESGAFGPLQGAAGATAVADFDPGFVAAQAVDVSPGGLVTAIDADCQVRTLQLQDSARTWREGLTTTPGVIRSGDGFFARGAPQPSGIVLLDRVWVGIGSTRGLVQRVASTGFALLLPDENEMVISTASLTAVSMPQGEVVPWSSALISPGDFVYAVGFGTADGEWVATMVFPASGQVAPIDEGTTQDVVGTAPDTLCATTWKGLATFFCCGPTGTYCGYNCSSSGTGWCFGGQYCNSGKYHIAGAEDRL